MNERIKELRAKLGLNQTQFARQIGSKQVTVSSWENGRQVPKHRKMQICQTFRVRREWLERGEGEIFDKAEVSAEDVRRIKREFVASIWRAFTDEQREIIKEALAETGLVVSKARKERKAKGEK